MGGRTRRFVAMIGTLVFLATWVWAAAAIGQRLPENVWAQLAFYAVAGIGWGVPLIPMLKWANRD